MKTIFYSSPKMRISSLRFALKAEKYANGLKTEKCIPRGQKDLEERVFL